MTKNIKISNINPETVSIEIEGVIGISEKEQFETPEQKIATYQKLKSRLESIKANEIIVNIRSVGGDVNDALLIYETLSALSAKITTRCYGYIASAATIIAQCAEKNQREISENSLYLIHKSTSTTEGNAQTIVQTADLLSKTDQRIANIYAVRSSKSAEEFLALMSENAGNGRWLSPQETIQHGLADRIIEAVPIKNQSQNEIAKLGLPQIPININNKNYIKMNKTWMAILDLLGIAQTGNIPQNAAIMPDELPISPQAETMTEVQNKVMELQNKISNLEAQNAKLKAKATFTSAKEDPSISESKYSLNKKAYSEDIKNFK